MDKVVYFEFNGEYLTGIIEKALVNTYILSVKTSNDEFNFRYHGKIAIQKIKCTFKGELEGIK